VSALPADFDTTGTKTRKVVNQTLDRFEQDVWPTIKGMNVSWVKLRREMFRDEFEQEEDEVTGEGFSDLDADILLLLLVEAKPRLKDRGLRYYAKKDLPDSSIPNVSGEDIARRLRRLRSKGLLGGNVKVGWMLSEEGRRFLYEHVPTS
jgi:hypothetical protein